MDRRVFITGCVGLLAAPLAAAAQQAKVSRIGWLSMDAPPSGSSPNLEAFRQGLRGLGYVEGQNIAIEYRYAEGREDRLPSLAAEVARLKVDVIMAMAAPVTRAAKNATETIPIVMIQSGDPIGSGLIAGLARPGGNVTGIVTLSVELIGKRLGLLKETFPKVSRVAVLSRAATPAAAAWLTEMGVAARALGLQLQSLEVQGAKDFDGVFEAVIRGRADALMELPNPLFHQNRQRIVDFAAKSRLPAMFHTRDFVDAGGLMSYGADYSHLYRRAASYVDKILKGAKPAELPVEQPTKFGLIINLKTAKALGLTIPQSVLVRADQVIE